MHKVYKPKYQDVLNALDYKLWRSSLEVEAVILKNEGLDRATSGVLAGELFVQLYKAVEKGDANRKERVLTKEELAVRNGRKAFEYKLTDDGLRKRHELEKSKEGKLEGMLVPVKAYQGIQAKI